MLPRRWEAFGKIKAVLGQVVTGVYISWKRGVQVFKYAFAYFSILSELIFDHKAFFFFFLLTLRQSQDVLVQCDI